MPRHNLSRREPSSLPRAKPERRARRDPSGTFRCRRCKLDVPMEAVGTAHRNHCPNCLWSRHLDDDTPGDRGASCGAAMEPIAVHVRSDGEWALVHRCAGCHVLRINRTAGDDNPLSLLRLAVRPLALPPFPMELLAQL